MTITQKVKIMKENFPNLKISRSTVHKMVNTPYIYKLKYFSKRNYLGTLLKEFRNLYQNTQETNNLKEWYSSKVRIIFIWKF